MEALVDSVLELARYRVDTESFYNDVRAAETDRERGEVLMEYHVSHLDSGYDPEPVDEDWYHEDIVPGIEEELGLEVPEVDVFRYEDSGQFVYDTFTASIDNGPLLELLGQVVERMVPDEDTDRKTRLFHDAVTQFNLAPGRKAMSLMGEEVCGVAEPEAGWIGYNVSGNQNRAERTGHTFDDIRDVVMVHETVHAIQFSEYPEVLDARQDAMREVKQYAEDPVGQVRESLYETDVTMIVSDPVSVLHDTLNVLAMPSMALVEGHAEFYMDRIADADIRAEFEMDDLDGLEGELHRFTPRGAKKAQYHDGKAFFQTLHERGGNEYVHYTMQHPPESMYAIRNPEKWADHVEQELS